MDVKEFAIANLGKTVRWKDDVTYPLQEGMIIGYSMSGEAVIISFTDTTGWDKETCEEGDIIILHSPLNVSFWYIYPNLNKRWEVIQ